MKSANVLLARHRLFPFLLLAMVLLVAGCATVPPQSWRPWLSDAGDPEEVPFDVPIFLSVTLELLQRGLK